MTEDRWIPSEEWETIVRNVPIPSVDLVVLHDEGILLGKRVNEPARGRWFVPGGRIRKQERIEDAVHRIAMEEIGVTIEIIERLGVYEHFYAAADVPTTDGKHYVPIGFTVKTDSNRIRADDQHSAFRVFDEPPPDLHEYTAQYLRDSEYVDY